MSCSNCDETTGCACTDTGCKNPESCECEENEAPAAKLAKMFENVFDEVKKHTEARRKKLENVAEVLEGNKVSISREKINMILRLLLPCLEEIHNEGFAATADLLQQRYNFIQLQEAVQKLSFRFDCLTSILEEKGLVTEELVTEYIEKVKDAMEEKLEKEVKPTES
jgi:hypothetical protein